MDYKDPYLIELKNEFEPFDIFNHKEDPYFPGVYLLQIKFTTGHKEWGLCIYDSNNNKFIEEPKSYDAYNILWYEVEEKYNFKHEYNEQN